MAEHPISTTQIQNRIYFGPNKTGDNIDATRAGVYGFGADQNWGRNPLPLVDMPYDYQSFSNADSNGNYQTITFKQGGSGGTTVRTLSLTYDGNNNVTSITRV